MFIKKIVLIAAAVAVAMSHVAAVEEATHIKIHVGYDAHHKAVADVNVTDSLSGSEDLDVDGSDEGSHDDDEGSHDDDGEERSDDDEEGSHDDSDEGSHDDDEEDKSTPDVASEALSEEDEGSNEEEASGSTDEDGSDEVDEEAGEPTSALCTGKDESPISVEGVEGVFCVTGQACADVQGACPGAQEGLPNGSYCGKVGKGVLGCKPNTTEPVKHHKKHKVVKLHAKPVVKKVQHKKPVVKKAEHKKEHKH